MDSMTKKHFLKRVHEIFIKKESEIEDDSKLVDEQDVSLNPKQRVIEGALGIDSYLATEYIIKKLDEGSFFLHMEDLLEATVSGWKKAQDKFNKAKEKHALSYKPRMDSLKKHVQKIEDEVHFGKDADSLVALLRAFDEKEF